MIKTLRIGFLAFVAAGVLLGLSGGVLQLRTAAAQTETQHLVDAPAIRPVIGGQYCHDLSKGELFVASSAPSNGLYCDPASAPSFTAPAVDPNWMPPADPGEG